MSFLQEAAAKGKQLADLTAALTQAPRSQYAVAVVLANLREGRHRDGGVLQCLDGMEKEVLTQAQGQDAAHQLFRWLAGQTEVRPSWTAFPDPGEEPPGLTAQIDRVLYETVKWIWDSPAPRRFAAGSPPARS